VTAHDGFTLNDLVSYNDKHNEANGEDNRDGANDNRSWNHGHEGPTDDDKVNDLRARQRRNMIATLLLSQGVPMLLHGDELGRTQNGNNNAYCQDNELSWVDWSLLERNGDLVDFTAAVVDLRHSHPVFRRRRFFAGRPIRKGAELRDIAWFTPAGEEMSDEDWESGFGRSIVVFLNGEGIPDLDRRGGRVTDDSFLMCFNAHDDEIETTLPNGSYGSKWTVVLDTATGEVTEANGGPSDGREIDAGTVLPVPARSLIVLQRTGTAE
jgi:glycogen operon protein